MTGVTQHHRSSLLLAAGLSASLLLSGCIYQGWPFHKSQPVPELNRPDSGRTGETSSGGGLLSGEGVGWKVVNGKREPHFLLARDGTECMVPKARWEAVLVGETAFCVWSRQQP